MLRRPLAAWRARSRAARAADIALVAAIALIAVAVVANIKPTIRDTKRSHLDLRLAKAYFRSHPELGHFTLPITKTRARLDLACAYPAASDNGVCMQIDARTYTTDRILRTWRCHQSPTVLDDPLPGPGAYYCPLNHARST